MKHTVANLATCSLTGFELKMLVFMICRKPFSVTLQYLLTNTVIKCMLILFLNPSCLFTKEDMFLLQIR